MDVPGGSYTRTAIVAAAAMIGLLAAATPASGANAAYSGISGDGTRIWFETTDKLVAADNDTAKDVYERSGGVTTLISGGTLNIAANFVGANADGTDVAFTTGEPLRTTDTEGFTDVYVQREGQALPFHVSRGAVGGNGAFSATFRHISADGNLVTFTTDEKLAAADTDANARDVYQRNFAGSSTSLVSLPESGHTPANIDLDINYAAASTNGMRIFTRTEQRLTPGDTDSELDIYRHRPETAFSAARVSFGPDGGNGPHPATLCGIDESGTLALFLTSEKLDTSSTHPGSGVGDPRDGDNAADVYVREVGDATWGVSTHEDGNFGVACAGNLGASDNIDEIVFFESAENFIDHPFGGAVDQLGNDDVDGNDTDLLKAVVTPSNNSLRGGTSDVHRYEYRSLGGDGVGAGFAEGIGSQALYVTDGNDSGSDTDACGADGCRDVYRASFSNTTLESTGSQNQNSAHNVTFEDASGAVGDIRVLFTTAAALEPSDTDSSVDAYLRIGSTTAHLSSGSINGDGEFDVIGDESDPTGTHHVFRTAESLVTVDGDTDIDVYESEGVIIRLVSRDTRAPTASVTSGPTGTTADNTPTFGFGADETGVTFQCEFDDATPDGSCSGAFSHTPAVGLSDGPHIFYVRATDSTGNVGGVASRAFTVDASAPPDTTPPTVTITSGPDPGSTTAEPRPTFEFEANEAVTFTCGFDTVVPVDACSGPGNSHTPATDLSEGPHTFYVRAVDAATNSTTVSRSFSVDTTPPPDMDPPQTTILSGPPRRLRLKRGKRSVRVELRFTSDEEGSTYRCRVDAKPQQSCTSPFVTRLRKGRHTIKVFAIDPAGNPDPTPATRTVRVRKKRRR